MKKNLLYFCTMFIDYKMEFNSCKQLLNRGIIIFLFVCFLLSCQTRKEIAVPKPCSTKYPILLVHGVSFRDDVPFFKYWSHLPNVLEMYGAKVYLANHQAFNSHVENALLLRERVLEILSETGCEKINIIAHSKGGVESRYLITKLDMADKVASLTTLASPHRGSYIADTILCWLSKKNWLNKTVRAANSFGQFLGDKNPDALTAAQNLTLEYMQDFNQSVPNMPQVYYQSYGATVSKDYPAWLVNFQHKILLEKEGENDCTVSLKSYQWGNFKGVVKSDQDIGVSHFDIVGMKFVSKQSTFDAERFFIEIVADLKERGF